MLYNTLEQYANTFDEKYKIKFVVTDHFIERVLERYNGNWDRAYIDIVRAIKDQICVIIYYLHLDTILPERGRIDVGEYQIRGNVINDRYVLNTFF